MKILFICDEYPPGRSGGVGSMVRLLGRELAWQGHGVYVAGLYTYGYGGPDYEEDAGVKVWRMRYGLRLMFDQDHIVSKLAYKLPDVIKRRLNGKRAFGRFISFVEGLVEREKIDIIEIPDWNTFAMIIGFTVRWPAFTVPLLLKSHGSYTKICHDTGREPKAKLAFTDRLLFSRADAIAAVSRDCAETDKKLFRPNVPIDVLYNGIEVRSPSTAERSRNTAIFSGSLTGPKGIFRLAEAWNIVAARLPAARLEIFGKGPVAPIASLLSERAGSTVRFHGHVARESLLRALEESTLAVFPSYTESFALAPMEAMERGCPVIYTTRTSGPELITDGLHGLLADPDDVEGLAAKIILLFSDEPLRRRLAERGRKRIEEEFSIQVVAENHVGYYRQIIDKFKHA